MTQVAHLSPQVDDFIESLQPIASEIGVGTAIALTTHFGGSRLYVPLKWRETLDLNVLGVEEAQKLCQMFGPERIDIPKMPWTVAALRRFVAQMRSEGGSNGEIARQIGVSWRTVTRLAGAPSNLTNRRGRATDEQQGDLVDWLSRSN